MIDGWLLALSELDKWMAWAYCIQGRQRQQLVARNLTRNSLVLDKRNDVFHEQIESSQAFHFRFKVWSDTNTDLPYNF